MLKTISLFGLAVALGAATILFMGTPRTTQVMAREEAPQRAEQVCPLVDVVVDEGYGVTRHVRKPSCTR